MLLLLAGWLENKSVYIKKVLFKNLSQKTEKKIKNKLNKISTYPKDSTPTHFGIVSNALLYPYMVHNILFFLALTLKHLLFKLKIAIYFIATALHIPLSKKKNTHNTCKFLGRIQGTRI